MVRLCIECVSKDSLQRVCEGCYRRSRGTFFMCQKCSRSANIALETLIRNGKSVIWKDTPSPRKRIKNRWLRRESKPARLVGRQGGTLQISHDPQQKGRLNLGFAIIWISRVLWGVGNYFFFVSNKPLWTTFVATTSSLSSFLPFPPYLSHSFLVFFSPFLSPNKKVSPLQTMKAHGVCGCKGPHIHSHGIRTR